MAELTRYAKSVKSFIHVLEFAFVSYQNANPKFQETIVNVFGVISEVCLELN